MDALGATTGRSDDAGLPRPASRPFWVLVHKEMRDHISSWRFIILLGLMVLTAIGSLYTAMVSIRSAIAEDETTSFVFLKLFTATDGTLPPFITFVSLLGPIIGIALGFDAVNAERSKGTLARLLAQPVPRDTIINAKFVAGLLVVAVMMLVLGFLTIGMGILMIGIPPTAEEFFRIVLVFAGGHRLHRRLAQPGHHVFDFV